MEQIIRIGMDTSKHIFQLHGVDAAERPVLCKRLGSRLKAGTTRKRYSAASEDDVVDENVVQPGFSHRDFPRPFATSQQMRIRLLPQGVVTAGLNPTGGRASACV